MPDPGRVVEVRATQAGSGYLITGGLVLTAWHVVRPKPGEPMTAVRVRVEQQIAAGAAPASAEQDAEVLWPLTDPGEDLDFALLRLSKPLSVSPVSWAPLAGFGKVSVQALGFPNMGIDRERNVRDAFPVDGWTFPARWLRALKDGKGTFVIHLSAEDQPAGHPSEVWPGMSGAAVFSGDHLVGIISLAGAESSRGVLHGRPVQWLFERADVIHAAARSHCPLPARLGSPEAVSHPLRQALDFDVYIQRKREAFTGRDWLFKEIDQWLATETGRRALLIKADYGVGKSAFMAEYVHRHQGERVLAGHFCRYDRPETLQPGRFVRSIATQLAEVIPAYGQILHNDPDLLKDLEQADDSPASALEMAVLGPLVDLPEPAEAQLLLVDALDESLEGPSGTGLVELLAEAADYFPRWLRLLATSRPVPAVVDALRVAFKPHEILADDTANLEDLRQYVLGAASRKGIQGHIEASGRSPEFLADLLRDKSGGKFLFVVHALRELADGTLSVATLDEMPPEGMDGFYRLSFRRRFGQKAERYAEARAVLEVICAAHEPLALVEIAQILGVSEGQVLRVQEQIPDFIKLRIEGRRSHLSFDHFSLKEWLTLTHQGRPRAGDFAVNLPEAHASIHHWALKRVEAADAHGSPYLLRHLASHLQDDAERQRIYILLLLRCFEWSQARLDLTGIAGLLADVEHLGAHPEQPVLQALIRQAEPALRHSASQWSAQLLGRLGIGSWNIGLESLATAAHRWVLTQGDSHAALLPLRRSLLWREELQRKLEGEAPILALADGRIAYARGKRICVCDPGSTDEPQVFEGHSERVTALAALPDGHFASGSDDGTVRVWSLSGAAPRVLAEHLGKVAALTVLRDGRVVSGGGDGLRIWSLTGGAPAVLVGTTGVRSLVLLPDGRVAGGCDDRLVRVWSLEGRAPEVLEGHTGPVRALAVLPDGRLVSGSDDGSVRVWSFAGAAPIVLRGHTGGVTSVAALPDGRVVSGGWDRSLRVWSLTGAAPQVLTGHIRGITAVAVLPDGQVVSGSWDKTVRVWSLAGSGRRILEGHTEPVRALAALPDGRVASGSEDRTVRIWSPTGPSQVLEGHTDAVTALAVLPDGRVASGSADTSVRIWSLIDSAPVVLEGHTKEIRALAVLPDGRLVSGSKDASVRVWSLTGEAPQVLKGHDRHIPAVTALPDGRVASGSRDNSVRVWSLTGAAPQVLEGHTHWVLAFAVLPDGRLASGSRDTTIRVWSLVGATSLVLEGHSERVIALAVLPDGPLVSGSWDGTLRVWSLTGSTPIVLQGHTEGVRALAVLPDGRVVSGGRDGSVRVWSRTFETQHAFVADAPIDCLTVTDTGMIAAGCSDGTVHLLRLPSDARQPDAPLQGRPVAERK